MRRIFFFFLPFFLLGTLSAQYSFSGKVVESDGITPIEFANIAILASDSSLVKGEATDEQGTFFVQSLSQGNYFLRISLLGYETTWLNIYIGENVELGLIKLQSSAYSLSEVSVEAKSRINMIDRQVILPTENQVKMSTSGFDLLQNMQLARISTDLINNKITISGGNEVQIRVNGIVATTADVVALRPDDVLRVEFHDNPGVRYGHVEAVLNFITRKKDSGGNISTNLSQGLSSTGFSDDYLATKFNHKNSEFILNGYYRGRKTKWTKANNETYVYPDRVLHRIEEGIPTKTTENRYEFLANYNLVDTDKYFFNAALRYTLQDNPHDYSNRESKLYEAENNTYLNIRDLTATKQHRPSLDLYFQYHLRNRQLLIFNVVGTYINSESSRNYQEERVGNIITDILSDVQGNKYSLITEGIYEKAFTNSKLTAGINHNQSYTNNKYKGTTLAEVGMSQTATRAYLEYQIKVNKFNYLAGLGITRTHYSQRENKVDNLSLNPSIRVSYQANNEIMLSYNGYVASDSPSLSDMNDVEQEIDPLRVRRGNPNLKSSWYFMNSLSVSYSKKIFDLEWITRYQYINKPVMGDVFLENDKFILTTNNQKLAHRLYSEVSFRIRPYKEYISLQIVPGINRYINNGNSYSYTYTNWYMRASLSASYKNWKLNAAYNSRYNYLWGETMYQGESFHVLSVGYIQPRWSLSVSSLFPFDKEYSRKDINYSKLTPKVTRLSTKSIPGMLLVTFTCNINFGRQFKASNKRLNNGDSDSGILSGSK